LARKNSFSKHKFQEEIMNTLNLFLRRKASDSRLNMVSITKVELNKDFSVATVYWDTYDAHKRGDAKAAISAATSRMRRELAQTLNYRQAPELRVVYDSSFEDENFIENLIEEESSSTDEDL